MERENRHLGSSLSWLGRIQLGLFVEDQGRAIPYQARGSGDDGRPQSSSIGGGGGAGQVGDFHRALVLHVYAFHQSGTAGQAAIGDQSRLLRGHRQWQSRDPQERSASKRFESVRQLVAV